MGGDLEEGMGAEVLEAALAQADFGGADELAHEVLRRLRHLHVVGELEHLLDDARGWWRSEGRREVRGTWWFMILE